MRLAGVRRILTVGIFLGLVASGVRGVQAAEVKGGNMELSVGQPAPSFVFKAPDGAATSLADLRGKTVVVYFYPKDDTPGCTKEACSFRDRNADFGKKGVVVLGVSADDSASHESFRSKYGLPFTLVPDPRGAIARSYGVFDEKRGMALRRTFIVNPEGRVAKVFNDVHVESHASEVLESLGK